MGGWVQAPSGQWFNLAIVLALQDYDGTPHLYFGGGYVMPLEKDDAEAIRTHLSGSASFAMSDVQQWLEREEERTLQAIAKADEDRETFLNGCLNIIRTLRGSLHIGRLPE